MGISQSLAGLNRTKMWRKGKFALCCSSDTHLLLPWDISIPGSRTFGIRLGLRLVSPCFLILHFAGGRLRDFSASIIVWANSYNNTFSDYLNFQFHHSAILYSCNDTPYASFSVSYIVMISVPQTHSTLSYLQLLSTVSPMKNACPLSTCFKTYPSSSDSVCFHVALSLSWWPWA